MTNRDDDVFSFDYLNFFAFEMHTFGSFFGLTLQCNVKNRFGR